MRHLSSYCLQHRPTSLSTSIQDDVVLTVNSDIDLAKRVHAACGWQGLPCNLEKLQQLHAHYDNSILRLKYADGVWKKVCTRDECDGVTQLNIVVLQSDRWALSYCLFKLFGVLGNVESNQFRVVR